MEAKYNNSIGEDYLSYVFFNLKKTYGVNPVLTIIGL